MFSVAHKSQVSNPKFTIPSLLLLTLPTAAVTSAFGYFFLFNWPIFPAQIFMQFMPCPWWSEKNFGDY